MKLGLWITARFGRDGTFEGHFEHLRDQVRLARDGEFAMIAGGQHFLGPRLQTLPLLARLAADAGEMEIATAVVLLPLLNPVDVAEQAATLNAMTGGRFILGVGLGHQADEREAFGISRDEVAGRFEEAMTVMDLVWSGEGRPFHGRFYSLPELKLGWPIPYPRPRVWIGGSSDRALRRARDRDLPWFPSELDLDGLVDRYATSPPGPIGQAAASPIGQAAASSASLGSARGASGTRSKASVSGGFGVERPVGIWVHIAETDDQAWADATSLGQVDPKRPNWPVAIIGSPETVAAKIDEHRTRMGATAMLLRLELPGMPQAEVMRRIELLAERVVPKFG